MKTLTPSEYQERFGIFVSEGQILPESKGGFVSLIRHIVVSNPLLTRLELNVNLIKTLQPLGIAENVIKEYANDCLEILRSLNEIVELYRNAQKSVFSVTRPRWIRLNENNAVLLGNVSDSIVPLKPIDNYDVVRRFVPTEENINLLADNEIEETTFSDWFMSSYKGEICKDITVNQLSALPIRLKSLLNEKEKALFSQNSEPLDGNICLVSGTGYWGSERDITGRWQRLSTETVDDIYFGMRINERTNEKSWLILDKQYETVKILSLYDKEQWRCLFLTKSAANNQPEYYSVNDTVLKFSVPLPIVLENFLWLFTSKQPNWGMWKICDQNLLPLLEKHLNDYGLQRKSF
jgi:hypothetical protein